ncbi:MAG: aspartate aminotransferase family protein [Phycisphaerales bacterium]|nr:aspartate aminotransferase family protein [Phycisphaerales bacterium]
MARRSAVVVSGLPRTTPVTVDASNGATLTDCEGKEFIDFASGIGVMNAGHCDPEVVEAICAQARKLLHSCIHISTYEPYVALCEKLVSLLPHGPEGTKCLLLNAGSEAVENAIKIARMATGRAGIVCYTDAFHGRSMMAMTLTSKVTLKQGCGPFAPEVYRLPFPNHFRNGDGRSVEQFARDELARFEYLLTTSVSAEHLAAVIIEPIQGEGGFVAAPPAYLRGLRDICDRHGIVLIFDEVQSGFCRTGKWAAYQHFNITPDLSTWAKSMGGGLPIGAVIGRASVMDRVKPATLGGTYTGNPVACAAALANIGVLEKRDLNAAAERIGGRIRDRFTRLQKTTPLIGDVRGVGAMNAIELVLNGDPAQPATTITRSILDACVARGLLVIGAGIYGNVIRTLPPLVIEDAQLDCALHILEEEIVRHARAASAA